MKEGFGLPPGGQSRSLPGAFRFECGATLPSITLGYHTYGTLAPDGSNAVLVGHSLTSNSAVHEWWGALLGAGPAFALDTERYFVVCVNYMGSVYGSTGPLERRAGGGPPLSADFPAATLKDNVAAQRALLAALGVRRVALAVGGSLGGMLALEWAASAPEMVDALCVVGCCGRHPDWAIGFGEAGRQAIFADAGWEGGYYALRGGAPPLSGMAAARQLAMLSYRTPQSLSEKFGRALVPGGRPRELAAAQGGGGAPFFDVEGYLNYQGEKFRKRFDPLSYVRLTQLLDSHDLGRGRPHAGGDYRAVLRTLPQRALVVGIDSDLLYPVRFLGGGGGRRVSAPATPTPPYYTRARTPFHPTH
jgi:homoserine O-acetyltransferase